MRQLHDCTCMESGTGMTAMERDTSVLVMESDISL